MNHQPIGPLKLAAISLIVFIATLAWLLKPRDDTSLERSSVQNLRQEQTEGANDKNDDYPFAKNVDGMVIFNEYDYQAFGLADGAKIMGEAFCGLRVATSGTTVTVTPYRHHEMYTKVKSIAYTPVSHMEPTKLTTVNFNENTSFDLNGKPDGVYKITVTINDDIMVPGYVVKRGNVVHTFQTVEYEDVQSVSKSLEIFHKFTDNLNLI